MKIISEIISFFKILFGKNEEQENQEYLSLVKASKSFGELPDEKDGDENLYSVEDIKKLD